MNIKDQFLWLKKPITLGVCAIACSILFTSQLSAQTTAKMNSTKTAKQFVKGANAAGLEKRLLRQLSRNTRLSPKAVEMLSKTCGCSVLPQDDWGSFGSCFKKCLADVGVSPYALIMCGVSCAAASTGVGTLICAICVGVSVTVIEVCALGCLAYPDGMKGPGSIMGKNLKHGQRNGSGATKLMRRTVAASG